MKSTLLSIADKVDPTTQFIYDDIATVANAAGADWLVIGATARDMIYHAAFGLPIKRATADIDFAINIEHLGHIHSNYQVACRRSWIFANEIRAST